MLSVNNISFSYLDNKTLNDISFSLEKGKILSIIGESGCGKSTLLKLIYGLYDLDEGSVFWNEKEILGQKFNLIPGMEYMKYLAQDFDLMPFITVAENVGKYLSNIYKDKKNQRIAELLEIVEMTEYANVKAKFLSGGQMQRVALARVLALEPEVLLLDEPFSHIDNFRKNSLRRKLFGYLKEKQITTILATHDNIDVLSFADEVVIMKEGQIIELGKPNDIYNKPKNFYIASLFGDVNEIQIDRKKKLLFPHQLEVVENSELSVVVKNNYYKGNYYLVESEFDNQTVFFESQKEISKGSVVFLKEKRL
ncbi:ABC transporter ATP-binding protein [Flavobacterium sp.]|uniref:ABC transporter ATP-binding protein n=1 Tax=Flavobacterium sp. TaxID=239 RepID=UPI0035B36A0A